MQIEKLGERNIRIAFGEDMPTTTHIIIGENRVYVCDTYLGPLPMQEVSKLLETEGAANRPIVVFNSHADWDHIWGNCYFTASLIAAHSSSRKRVLEDGENDLKKWGEYVEGEVTLIPPNLLFDTKLIYADDGVEFYHTPGHTIDSSSCYDHQDKVLFVGDNVEADIPYVNHLNFDSYIKSLNSYLQKDWIALVPGHGAIQYDSSLVRSNITHLEKFREWKVDIGTLTEGALRVHLYALMTLVDELIGVEVEDRVRVHYSEALEHAQRLEQTEKIQSYIERISIIANNP